MLFANQIKTPASVILESDVGLTKLDAGSDGEWGKGSISLRFQQDKLFLNSPKEDPVRLMISWKSSLPEGTRFLNDHWERGYGDLHWGRLGSERFFPWYFMAFDGQRSFGCGVKVRPNAFCHWLVVNEEVRLICDLRNGVHALKLGSRELAVAEIVTGLFEEGSPYQASESFCGMMCDDPLTLSEPVYGFNDWYYIYGSNSRETVLRDTDMLQSLTQDNTVRPYSVIDDGWQLVKNDSSGGPWQSNALFGDMADLAAEIKKRDAHPGIWTRPLMTHERVADNWVAKRSEAGLVLDPTHPEVSAKVTSDIQRLSGWGFDLIKHDFSTFDITGLWGFEMGTNVYGTNAIEFQDRSLTTAEIILNLYRTIRSAAGDSLLIGCNTIGHLAAGLVEIQRTGDDTSGKEWGRTLKMGVNTLAFRMPQHNRFFVADADCVGLTNEIPWEVNAQWLDVLANSGTPLFVSAAPQALDIPQQDALKNAFKKASRFMQPAEPLDWLDTTTPSKWKTESGEVSYTW